MKKDIPFLLIGNKRDLLEEVGRTLPQEATEDFVSKRDSIYIETSAKTGANVEEAFWALTRRMIDKSQPKPAALGERKPIPGSSKLDRKMEDVIDEPVILEDEGPFQAEQTSGGTSLGESLPSKKMGQPTREEEDLLPETPLETQGLMIKGIFREYGGGSLELIRDAFHKRGKFRGLELKRKFPGVRTMHLGYPLLGGMDAKHVKILEISEEHFRLHVSKCPYCLEGTSRDVCHVVAEKMLECFRTALEKDVKAAVRESLAEGDPACDLLFFVDSNDSP